jgi:hypothetical protein
MLKTFDILSSTQLPSSAQPLSMLTKNTQPLGVNKKN